MVKAGYLFTAEDAAAWSGGELRGNAAAAVSGAEVDSRRCDKGVLFFALDGERVNGHDYIGKAFENGACGTVIAESWAVTEAGSELAASLSEEGFILVVADPLQALQQIAAEYMKKITRPVRIAVTGSNGKTTTKELIASVLSEKFSVVKTAGNYNSEIGLPLTVFNINNEHDYAVIEMGINRLGEMDVLTEILRPDLVVITNIGTAHIGIFKSIETIAFEKRRSVSLFDGKGILFVSEDEPYADFLADGLKGECRSYGKKSIEADYGDLSCVGNGLKGWNISVGGANISFPLIGEHNLKNAFCAFSLGFFAGLTVNEIKTGLEKAEPLFGRSEIISGQVTIIQDSYNANADSLLKSIKFADELEWKGGKHYVLGDMKELGENSLEMHQQVGSAASESSADRIVFFGSDSFAAYERAKKTEMTETGSLPVFFHTEDYEILEKEVVSGLNNGDLLLLKGSRSMNLERLLEPVKNKFRGAEC